MNSFIKNNDIDDFLETIDKKDKSIFDIQNEEKKSSINKSYNTDIDKNEKTIIEETPYR
jgi:hypothetical protein